MEKEFYAPKISEKPSKRYFSSLDRRMYFPEKMNGFGPKLFRHDPSVNKETGYTQVNNLFYRLNELKDNEWATQEGSLVNRLTLNNVSIELKVENGVLYTTSHTHRHPEKQIYIEHKLREDIDPLLALVSAHNSIIKRISELEYQRRMEDISGQWKAYKEAEQNRELLHAVDKTFESAEVSEEVSQMMRKTYLQGNIG